MYPTAEFGRKFEELIENDSFWKENGLSISNNEIIIYHRNQEVTVAHKENGTFVVGEYTGVGELKGIPATMPPRVKHQLEELVKLL